MVTLKSPGEVFAVYVFPIRKQITCVNLISTVFSLIIDLFVLPRILYVDLIN